MAAVHRTAAVRRTRVGVAAPLCALACAATIFLLAMAGGAQQRSSAPETPAQSSAGVASVEPRASLVLPWDIKPTSDSVFSYRTPQSPDYLRVLGFQVGVLGGGMIWYYWNKDSNKLDWEYNYDWETFRAKLEGSGYSFDSNLFDTNALAHTGAGTLYYIGARGSRMSAWGSLAVAFSSSLLWEFIGEFRERVSVNDTLSTPFGGVAFGESLFQLGAFFDRSCETTSNRILASLFSPTKTYSDYRDDAQLLRSSRCDRFGFTRVGHHEFDLSAGPRLVRSAGATSAEPYVVGEVRARAEVLNLRRFGQPGQGWMSFSDGNSALVEVVAATGTMGVEDFRVDARSLLAGLHYRNISRGSGGVNGREFLLGTGVGVEYSRHMYGGADQRPDPVFVLELPTLLVRWRWLFGPRQLDVGVAAAPSYASVGTFALPTYDLDRSREELTTVARQHGYNHAFGVSLTPRIVWSAERVRIGVEGRNDRLFATRALDREAETESRSTVTEIRRRARLWFETGPRLGLRYRLDVAARDRRGRIDDLERRVTELRIGTGLTGAF